MISPTKCFVGSAGKFGVPTVLLAMIRSFHEDTRAAVLVKRRRSSSFTVILDVIIWIGRGAL